MSEDDQHSYKLNIEKQLLQIKDSHQAQMNQMAKENDNMKEEMVLLQKYTRKIETDLADLSDLKDRQEKDVESFKKKY